MPKGKRKTKSGGQSRQQQDSNFPSEEDSVTDNCSVISNISELHLESDDETLVENEDILVSDFEDKLKDAIENTSQKSAKGRVSSLEVIIKCLTSKYLFDFILDRKITMCDVVERSLKKGKGQEQILGANLASLICIHLGSVEDSEAVFQSLQPVLQVLLADPSVSPAVRSQCASSLGLCCFISCSGPEVIQSTMDSLYSVFSASFLKGNGAVPTFKPEICSLHSNALLAWSLLLTILSPPYILDLLPKYSKKLPELLESIDVDLRIAAGETLAVFYELGRQCRPGFQGHDIDTLCDTLRLLATDGQKFRAKKDRRQQRSSFRDILKSIEEQEPLDIRVKIGKEALYIEDWCHKRQYDAFCQILGSGMNLHLKQNELLRDIFDLGAPIIEVPKTKNSKLQRHSAHLAACKARTIFMSKLRDKRADVMA